MVAEGHAYRLCSLGKSCGNDAVELGRRGIPADMVVDGDNVSRDCRLILLYWPA